MNRTFILAIIFLFVHSAGARAQEKQNPRQNGESISSKFERNFDIVAAEAPPEAAALNDRAVLLLTNKQYERAIESFCEAVKLAPDIKEIQFNFAYALQKKRTERRSVGNL